MSEVKSDIKEYSSIVSERFTSNCLFEAVKAYTRNHRNVKIVRLGELRLTFPRPHYYWINVVTNEKFDFVGDEYFFYKGVIRRRISK